MEDNKSNLKIPNFKIPNFCYKINTPSEIEDYKRFCAGRDIPVNFGWQGHSTYYGVYLGEYMRGNCSWKGVKVYNLIELDNFLKRNKIYPKPIPDFCIKMEENYSFSEYKMVCSRFSVPINYSWVGMSGYYGLLNGKPFHSDRKFCEQEFSNSFYFETFLMEKLDLPYKYDDQEGTGNLSFCFIHQEESFSRYKEILTEFKIRVEDWTGMARWYGLKNGEHYSSAVSWTGFVITSPDNLRKLLNYKLGINKVNNKLKPLKDEKSRIIKKDNSRKRTGTVIQSSSTRQIASASRLVGDSKTAKYQKTGIGRSKICGRAISV